MAAEEERVLNVLMVEDNEEDVFITGRAFRKSRYPSRLFVVRSGEETINFIRREGIYRDAEDGHLPDVILLDILMPGMNGFEVLEWLKAYRLTRGIPVVMFTSSTHEEDIQRGYKLGAAGFMQKRVVFDELQTMIDGFLFYWIRANRLPARPELIQSSGSLTRPQ